MSRVWNGPSRNLKMNHSSFPFALVCNCLIAALNVGAYAESVSPKPIPDVLINPGKGWILYGWPHDHSTEVLSLSSTGYNRYEWSQIEPAEGKYNWKPIDDQVDAWKKAGKQFSLGVMCLNSHTETPGGYSTPKWVFDAGAKFTAFDLKSLRDQYSGTLGVRIIPDFVDPIFIAKQKAFLTALAARYDGNPNLAFIDIRAYGNWGENHMWPFGIPDISADDYRAMIQMHLNLFQHTTLELSAGTHQFDSVLDWAAKHGVGIRRDGVCGNSDGSECARSLGHAPAVFEFFGSYTWMKQNGWWDGKKDALGQGFRLSDCVENGKPSYIGMSHWDDAKKLLAAEKPLVEKLANRMGYHVALKKAAFSESLTVGSAADFKFEWQNDGVTPIYVPCALAVALLDAKDSPAEIAIPTGSAPAHWAPDKTTSESAQCTFTDAPPGKYRVAVGLVSDAEPTKPIIRLANEGRTAGGWYVVGTIELRRDQ